MRVANSANYDSKVVINHINITSLTTTTTATASISATAALTTIPTTATPDYCYYYDYYCEYISTSLIKTTATSIVLLPAVFGHHICSSIFSRVLVCAFAALYGIHFNFVVFIWQSAGRRGPANRRGARTSESTERRKREYKSKPRMKNHSPDCPLAV